MGIAQRDVRRAYLMSERWYFALVDLAKMASSVWCGEHAASAVEHHIPWTIQLIIGAAGAESTCQTHAFELLAHGLTGGVRLMLQGGIL